MFIIALAMHCVYWSAVLGEGFVIYSIPPAKRKRKGLYSEGDYVKLIDIYE